MHWHVLDNQSTPERCWFGQRVNIFSHIFAILIWGCAGDRVEMVVNWKCIVELFWGQNCLHVENASPKTVPQCTFSWQPSRPGLLRNLKVANTLAPVDSAGRLSVPGSLYRAHSLWKEKLATYWSLDSYEHHLHDIFLFQAFGISENFPLRYTWTRNCNKY